MFALPRPFQPVPREEPFQRELLLDQVVEEEVPILLVLEVETWEVLERLLEGQVETYLDQELLVLVEVAGTYQAHLGDREEEAVLDQRDYRSVDTLSEQHDETLALKKSEQHTYADDAPGGGGGAN